MLNDFETHLAIHGMEMPVNNSMWDILNYNSNLVLQFTDPEINELAEVFPFERERDGSLNYKTCRNQLREFLNTYPSFRANSKMKIGTKIYTAFQNNQDIQRPTNRTFFH